MTTAQSRTAPDKAARLAAQCFALARSTEFAGERDAAVARGMAIVEKAGLSLDDFDIPGRTPDVPPSARHHARGSSSAPVIDIFVRAAQAMEERWNARATFRSAIAQGRIPATDCPVLGDLLHILVYGYGIAVACVVDTSAAPPRWNLFDAGAGRIATAYDMYAIANRLGL